MSVVENVCGIWVYVVVITLTLIHKIFRSSKETIPTLEESGRTCLYGDENTKSLDDIEVAPQIKDLATKTLQGFASVMDMMSSDEATKPVTQVCIFLSNNLCGIEYYFVFSTTLYFVTLY